MRGSFHSIDRQLIALACSNAGGWFSGLASEGFFVGKRSLALCFGVAITAGAAGALVGGKRPHERRIFLLPFVLFSLTVMLATAWYVRGRDHVYPGELVVPSAMSLVPFAIVQRQAQRRADAAVTPPEGDT
jgi:hypothetical protein